MNSESTFTTALPVTSVAQVCLERLGTQYVRLCLETKGRMIPVEADLKSLACVLLCEEYRQYLRPKAYEVVTTCRDVSLQIGVLEWLDSLVWDCCRERLEDSWEGCGAENLLNNLAHHSSNIRSYLFDLAWLLRRRLPRESAAPLLLRNVADTIGHWALSLGLCASLFEDEEQFYAFAEKGRFGSFQDQFEGRIKDARKYDLTEIQAPFYMFEIEVRKRIEEVALACPASQLGQ